MGAKIWYYPDPASTVVEIDLGEDISDLQKNGTVIQSASESIAGAIFTSQTSARSVVRIVNERFTSYALARQLETLENHLRRGGSIAFAEDSDRAVAGYLKLSLPASGVTAIEIQGKPWPYETAADFATLNNEAVIQSASPRYLRELVTVSAESGDEFTISPLVYDYSEEPWVLFRHRGFWPLLRLPIGSRNQKMLTHDHRISWTFDAQLEEHVAGLDIFSGVADEQVITNTPFGGVVSSTVPEIIDGPGVGGGGKFGVNDAIYFGS